MSRKHKRHEEHEEHVDESWLVPYADILTLLLALFVVLYSMNQVDVKKFQDLSNAFKIAFNGGVGVLDMPSTINNGSDFDSKIGGSKNDKDKDSGSSETDQEKEETITQEQLKEIIAKSEEDLSKLKEELDQYIAANGLSTTLETSLNMSQLVITIRDHALFNSAEAKVSTDGEKLAVYIAKMLDNYPDYNVIVSGHTDNTPIKNREFSSNWDLSVMRAVRFMDIMLNHSTANPARFSAVGYGEYHPVADNSSVEGRAQNRRVELSIVSTFLDENRQQIISVQGN